MRVAILVCMKERDRHRIDRQAVWKKGAWHQCYYLGINASPASLTQLVSRFGMSEDVSRFERATSSAFNWL